MKSPKRIAPFDPQLDRSVNLDWGTVYGSCECDPRFERGTALVARDERVARSRRRCGTTTCQRRCVSTTKRAPLCNGTRASVVGIGQTVGTGVHQQHVAVGIVGELEPRAHDPAVGRRVEAVVVVAVEAAERGVVILGLELDRAHAAEVGADAFDVAA